MRNKYNDKELADQLQLDLAEGESWHIEFKEYDHIHLDTNADSWKNDLSHELAALASIGGKIYIGINDARTVVGIGGTHQAWQEKLFERAVGRVKPRVNWKSYHFVDPATGLSLIRLDVLEGEPIYYVQGKPYILEGTTSRPAEPEEVKALFKTYFANHEPILPTELEGTKNDNREQTTTISWIGYVLMNILSSLHFQFWLSKEEQKANHYKEIADEIEKLSWARTNADYRGIKQALPELQQKLKIS